MSFLGIDTSNYTTSLSLVREGRVVCNLKKSVYVAEHQRGVRQSDALFCHVKNLPILMEELGQIDDLEAIGYSSRPRDVEGSYMPCFLAGELVARSLSANRGVPVYPFSHQAGHIRAALYSAGALHLVGKDFLAFHVSGGTTEAVVAHPRAGCFDVELVGYGADLHAGQVIDRVGVDLEMPFPAGPYVEQAALKSDKDDYFRVKVQGCTFSFSGVQNQYQARIKAGESREDICRFVLNTVAHTILKATKNARKEHNLPVLISGGVSVCSLVQDVFTKEKDLWFAQKGLGGDNAVGTAILASMR